MNPPAEETDSNMTGPNTFHIYVANNGYIQEHPTAHVDMIIEMLRDKGLKMVSDLEGGRTFMLQDALRRLPKDTLWDGKLCLIKEQPSNCKALLEYFESYGTNHAEEEL